MSRPLVSINIVAFNAHDYIKKAVRSALEQTHASVEINILDNNSRDDTVVLAKSFKDERIRLYESRENTGFAKGHNILIEKSKGEYIILLNQDAWLDPHFAENALAIFHKRAKIGALQPKLYKYDFARDCVVTKDGLPVIDATGLVMLKNRRVIARGQGQIDKGQFQKEEEVFGADGALPIYARTALEDIKIPRDDREEYFDEDFFMYKEDVDLSWRLRLYGWNIFYSPQLLGYHARGSGESASTNYFDIIQERRNISKLAKSLSWRNQRLMQVKNEQISLFARHFPFILFKEIASFAYIIIFERYALRSIKDFFSLLARAIKKRRIIMARVKAHRVDMAQWFS